ncbi:MAG: NUDIX domain-containing protein [Micrococcales bacterium]|nr:NUDIX domain-containing protein [Micrococcales bacterium]
MPFSAGLVPVRRSAHGLEIFLVHMAGPYWAHKDHGAWSIAKGEYDPTTEDARAVAAREFQEEVGRPAPGGEWLDAGETRMPSGKRVRAFVVETDEELAFVSSNLFDMEWPPRSGQIQQFPETDDAQWFTIEVAQVKIVSGQRPILEAVSRVIDL